MSDPAGVIQQLRSRFDREGRVRWLGLRPARQQPVVVRQEVMTLAGAGLEGDHYGGGSGKRGITLIQLEHLAVIGALLEQGAVDPARLRRNIVIEGINLLALRGCYIRVGQALLEVTGPCAPCSRMETELGQGGYNAMRGHGGVTARVIEGGRIRQGDSAVFAGLVLPAE